MERQQFLDLGGALVQVIHGRDGADVLDIGRDGGHVMVGVLVDVLGVVRLVVLVGAVGIKADRDLGVVIVLHVDEEHLGHKLHLVQHRDVDLLLVLVHVRIVNVVDDSAEAHGPDNIVDDLLEGRQRRVLLLEVGPEEHQDVVLLVVGAEAVHDLLDDGLAAGVRARHLLRRLERIHERHFTPSDLPGFGTNPRRACEPRGGYSLWGSASGLGQELH